MERKIGEIFEYNGEWYQCVPNKECNEDRGLRAGIFFFAIIVSIFLGMIISDITTPTIEDYIHGKVRTEIRQIYKNGEFVRCDTNYYKL